MQGNDNGTPAFTADCGHLIPALPPGHCGGTGYAVLPDGKRICYACASERERAAMIATGRATLYLVKRAQHDRPGIGPVWFVTDWPGTLEFPAYGVVKSYGYGFGRRYDVYTGYFRGPDGYVWSLRNAGDSQIAHVRRTKQRSK